MSSKIVRKEAELKLLKAEEAFVAKKESGKLTRKDKLALRELRQEFRDEYRKPKVEGAAPGVIGTKAEAGSVE